MKYQFGPFELCDQSLVLTKKNIPVHIEPLAFRVLLLMLQNTERCILRDEFFDELWPGVVVSDGALSNEIKNLRRLLGDTGTAQNYIRTVRSRGYQFINKIVTTNPTSIAQNLSTRQLAEMDPNVSSENRLPNIPIRFSGREDEVELLIKTIQSNSLVNIQGAGGLGKTSLAVSIAHRALALFPDGVYFISLISATSAFDALNLLHRELKIEENKIALEPFESGRSAAQLFAHKTPLVVFDNCEHLTDISQFIEGMLSNEFSGKICCTSRAPLKLNREYIFQLSGLQSQPEALHLKSDETSLAAQFF